MEEVHSMCELRSSVLQEDVPVLLPGKARIHTGASKLM